MNDPLVRELSLRERRILDRDDPRNGAAEVPFLADLFHESVIELLDRHSRLFYDGVSERTFAQRLGAILERRAREIGLTEHYADVEYNRLRGNTKYLPGNACICDNVGGRNRGHDNITADLILHGRGITPRLYENLIAVEIKWKDNDETHTVYDRCRLLRMSCANNPELYTAQDYRYAFFLVLRASRRRRGAWWYEHQVLADQDAALKLGNQFNVGYYETFILGASHGITAFPTPHRARRGPF